MNTLIDIGHPAHVHLYKNLAKLLKESGHNVFITVKDIPSAKSLLTENNLDYIELPAKSDSLLGKVFRQLRFDWIVYKLVKKYKIEIGIGTSVTNAHVSRLLKMQSVLFDDDDDEVQPLVVKWLHPYASVVLSPVSLLLKNRPRKHKNTIYYKGFHELAYLHPSNFIPNKNVLEELGLRENETFFVLRFNVFKAHHDIEERGLSLEQKLKIIEKLEDKGKIFITTERKIEPELEKYQAPVSNSKMHDLLYYASMFIGDSQTMTSEAAVLGTPSIRCNSFVRRIAYLDEQEEKYGLTFGFLPSEFDLLLNKLDDILSMKDIKSEWKFKRDKLLSEKMNMSAFMHWLIEGYPDTIKQLQENPEIQNRFMG